MVKKETGLGSMTQFVEVMISHVQNKIKATLSPCHVLLPVLVLAVVVVVVVVVFLLLRLMLLHLL